MIQVRAPCPLLTNFLLFSKKRPGLKYRDAIKILPNMVNILSITNCEEHWIGHAAHIQKSSIASKTQQLQV
jgi:hypothetical protein